MTRAPGAERTVFEDHVDPGARLDGDLTIQTQNAASLELFGEGAGHLCHEYFFGRSEPCPGCRAAEIREDGPAARWMMEIASSRLGDAYPRQWEVTLIPVRGEDGRATRFVELLRDATLTSGLERYLIELARRLDGEIATRTTEAEALGRRARDLQVEIDRLTATQADLLRTEQMVALGRLVASVAHEIHTPLGAIISTIDLLRRKLESGQTDGTADLTMLLQEAAERIRKVVRTLRIFSRLDAAVVERIDLRTGIESSLDLLAHEMRHRIEVVREFGEIPPVVCRPDQINQVFLNVLQNAVQAIAGKGTIRVRTFADEDTVTIEIEDSGPGVAEEDVDRIFDAGFTTKPPGAGTGWGLSICRRIVREHKGDVTVRRAPGGGAVFRIELPIEGHP